MAVSSPTSLIDRAGLDSAQVGRHLQRALEGADDGGGHININLRQTTQPK